MKKRKLKVMNILIAILSLVATIIVIFFVISSLKKDFKVTLKNTSIKVGEEFKNDFIATYKGIDVTNNVIVTDNINETVAGIYIVEYTYSKGENKYTVTKSIKVIDEVPPTISLKGGKDIIVITNQQFEDPGFVALDNSDGDITEKVEVSGIVDTLKDGEYVINYYVKDKSGNETSISRKVTVTSSTPLNMDIKTFSLDGFFENVTLKETVAVGEEYINNIIFAGDSMAEYYVINNQIPTNNLWYQTSITAETALTSPIYVGGIITNKTFVEKFKELEPNIVIMTLGTNSVPYMTPEYFYEKYYELVEKLKNSSPKTKIIIQSIPPVDKRFDETNSKINNDKINKFNYYIGKMCEELNVKFLNSAPALKDDSGACKEGYCISADGIHTTKEGQEVLIGFARTHVITDE